MVAIGEDAINAAGGTQRLGSKNQRQVASLGLVKHGQIELAVGLGEATPAGAVIGIGRIEANRRIAQEHHPRHLHALGDCEAMGDGRDADAHGGTIEILVILQQNSHGLRLPGVIAHQQGIGTLGAGGIA